MTLLNTLLFLTGLAAGLGLIWIGVRLLLDCRAARDWLDRSIDG